MANDERENEISQEVIAIALSSGEAKIPIIQEASTEKITATRTVEPQPPHTILSENQKIFTIITASFAAFISPVSGAIYFPALPSIARDLHVSISTINLTITVYMVPTPLHHYSLFFP
jgi:hypothetical protein